MVNVEPARPTKVAAVFKSGATAPGLAVTAGGPVPAVTNNMDKMSKNVKILNFIV